MADQIEAKYFWCFLFILVHFWEYELVFWITKDIEIPATANNSFAATKDQTDWIVTIFSQVS